MSELIAHARRLGFRRDDALAMTCDELLTLVALDSEIEEPEHD